MNTGTPSGSPPESTESLRPSGVLTTCVMATSCAFPLLPGYVHLGRSSSAPRRVRGLRDDSYSGASVFPDQSVGYRQPGVDVAATALRSASLIRRSFHVILDSCFAT